MTNRGADIPDNARSLPSTTYRPDVDGLRAIAIAAVLLFHAFPALFPGGFIGVDVFFVISGFLITGNISRSIASNSFTIGGFYLKRVRRIFPALITVLATCLAVGFFALTPAELMKLGRDIAAAAGFVSNLVYWADSGYFDDAAITKPLLHLWSLGIEEQFYLVWPLLMVLAIRLKRGRELAFLVVAASLIACIWTTAPQSSAAFFSPLTRMWQLGFGGLIALFGRNQEDVADPVVKGSVPKQGSWLLEVLSLAGLAAIVLAVFRFEGGAPYPGWRALVPTIGAGVIIAAGKSSLVNRVVLSNRQIVFVGLISYPLYLWHWPLLSFAHIIQLGVVPASTTVGLLAASVALATGTYLLVERPVHRSPLGWQFGRKQVGGLMAVGALGGALYWNRGEIPARQGAVDQAASRPAAAETQVAPRAQTPEPPAISTPSDEPAPRAASPEAPPSAEAPGAKDSGPPPASPVSMALELYQERVKKAMATGSGDPNSYLVQMVSSRLSAVRTGVCEYVDKDAPWPDPAKDMSMCETPKDGARNILILGDSIASDTYASLHSAYPEFNIIQRTGIGCNLQRVEENLSKPCIWTLRDGKEIALSPDIKLDLVVLASLWNIRSAADFNNSPAAPLVDSLLARGRKIIMMGPPVGFTILARDLVDKCPKASASGITAAELDRCARELSTVHRDINTAMKEIARQRGIPFVDLHELACHDRSCPILDEEGQLIYTDSWHRSYPGAKFLGLRLRQGRFIERAMGGR